MKQKSFNKSRQFGDSNFSEFDSLFETSNIVNDNRRERKNRFWWL